MDGASKFVRGDAIAGIIITAINIVVGLIVGVVLYDMTFAQAAEVFTLPTAGDGLVSQIPALVVSTAAGIVVTRTGGDDRGISHELHQQVFDHPKAIFICSALLGLMAVVPGMPALPFGILGICAFFIARYAQKQPRNANVRLLKVRIRKKAQRTPIRLNLFYMLTNYL